MTAAGRELVLVTGASGFVAGHCIGELLEHGYAVRGTVRDPSATGKVAHLAELAERTGGSLEFVGATLESDRGWAEAVAGCTYVLHVASPNPPQAPRNEDEVVRPAVDGTLRVLRAAAASGSVRRVVLTSSVSAVVEGGDRQDRRVRTEEDWSDPEACAPYPKSKTLAERAAWTFVEDLPDDRRLELTTINPGLVLGPLQHPVNTTSTQVIQLLLDRAYPACPQLGFAPVDVRDVAAAHRLAMTSPKAPGNRYICAGEHTWMQDMARLLADEFGPQGYRVPTGKLPNWLLWTVARFDRTARLALDLVGREALVSSEKAMGELGWHMRPVAESVLATGRSLVEHGLARTPR